MIDWLFNDLPWYIPLLIFFGRVVDVSIGTVRMMLVVQGMRLPSMILGFIEVVVWVVAAGSAIKYLSSPIAVLAFAGGFSAGNLVGMLIEQKLALGYRVVRIINPLKHLRLGEALRDSGFRVTNVDGHGRDGPVEMVLLAVPRRTVPRVLKLASEVTPQAFVSVERAERVTDFTLTSARSARVPRPWFAQLRK